MKQLEQDLAAQQLELAAEKVLRQEQTSADVKDIKGMMKKRGCATTRRF